VRAPIVAALALTLMSGTASAGPDLNAPFPRLKRGEKLCMESIAPRDLFYRLCRECEVRTSACTGDLRDRMRRSPYHPSGRCYWIRSNGRIPISVCSLARRKGSERAQAGYSRDERGR